MSAEFVEKLAKYSKLGEEITQDIYRGRIEIIKRIQKTIEEYSKDLSLCPLLDVSRGQLVYHRGIGPFGLAKLYYQPPGADVPNETIRVDFSVSCYAPETDTEDEKEFSTTCFIDVPMVLFEKFDEAKFKAWLKAREDNHKKRREGKMKAAVARLLKKYPEAKKLIKTPKAKV